MKRTILYTVIICILIFCTFLVLTKLGKASRPQAAILQNNESQPTSNIGTANNIQPTLPKTFMKRPSQMTNESVEQKLESLSNAVQNYSAQIHSPIQFYGKVVDENNQPIKGASVRFVWSHLWPLAEGTLSTNVVSDREGLFFIADAIGESLCVYVSKANYYNVGSMNIDSFKYSSYLGATPFHSDPSSPTVFHLRKKGSGVDLISATLTVKMARDATPVFVDFIKKHSGDNGQLVLSQTKPSYETWKQATSWTFKMEIPDGGFIEQSDEFPFEAPSAGYKSKIVFDFRNNQPDWDKPISKSYYFVFGTPPHYGRLSIETDITWGGARISYSINPEDSRNLEPKMQ